MVFEKTIQLRVLSCIAVVNRFWLFGFVSSLFLSSGSSRSKFSFTYCQTRDCIVFRHLHSVCGVCAREPGSYLNIEINFPRKFFTGWMFASSCDTGTWPSFLINFLFYFLIQLSCMMHWTHPIDLIFLPIQSQLIVSSSSTRLELQLHFCK